MSFLEILKFLNSLGPTLKDNWADILGLIEIVKRIFGRVNPVLAGEPGTLSVYQPTADESAELDALADNLGGPTAQVDIGALLGFAGLLSRTGSTAMGLLFVQFLKHLLAGK